MALWTRTHDEPPPSADDHRVDVRYASLRSDFNLLANGYDRLVSALAASGAMVVVHDEFGREVFSSIAPLVDNQHGDSLVLSHLIENVLGRAAAEGPVVERHDLIGPPARSVQIRATQIDGRDGPIGTIAVLDDITEASRLEQLRRELVVNVGHELRTPVGALGVLAETLVAEIESSPPHSDAVLRLARRMEDETFRLASLVNDVLELAAAQDVVPGLVRLVDVVEQAAGRVATAADISGIELALDPIDPTIVVPGERTKLVSAVYNLLDNAVKYSDRGSLVRATVRSDTESVWIDVIDRGIGIAPRDRARVFDRYFRVDRARTRETGGSGLGLAIVQEIVAAHNGQVTLRSVEGQGSIFTIQIPATVHNNRAPTQVNEATTR